MAKKNDIPDTLTFAEGRDLLADDLKSIAGFFSDAEKRCREGDLDAVPATIEGMSKWRQMLMLRFADKMERIEAGRSKQKSAVG